MGQTDPRFQFLFADFCRFSLFLRTTAFRRRRFSQETADFRRNPFVHFSLSLLLLPCQWRRPSEKFVGCFGLNFQKLPPNLSEVAFPKGPFRTKNTTTIEKIVNYYAVVFLLRPPNLLRHGPFLERENACNSQENGVCTRGAAIANHSAIVNSLHVVNLLRPLGYVEMTRRNAFSGNFLEVCLRTPGASQKLLQKSALRCMRLLSVLFFPKIRDKFEGKFLREEPKPKLFGPDLFGWGRGLPLEGVGAKTFGMSFERQGKLPNVLAGYPGISPGYPGGA